jgi:hypothetical protein
LKLAERGTNILFQGNEIASDCRHNGRISTNLTILLLLFYDASASQNMQGQMLRWLMNNKLESICKEMAVA